MIGSLAITILFAWYSRGLPDPDTLLRRNIPQSTKIYDRTGEVLLYEIHGDEKRTLIKLEDVPDIMIWATVAVEDKTFYSHKGLNLKRIFKAILVDVLQGKKAQGASTLTQQFIKNAVLTNEKSFDRKLKEMILALQIERVYNKDQILQMYFNEIPYGSTLYGVESAAQSYFGKQAKDLTLDEAALLAALPQAPDYYSPYGTGSRGDNRDALVQRQKTVLNLMAEQGYISKDEAEAAKQMDTLKKLQPKQIGDIKAPHFVTYVRSQLVEKYGQRTVEEGGLRVVTSLDWKKQQMAEEAVTAGVEDRGEKYNFSNSALVAINPKNGHVLSMVGSKDFFDQENDGQVNVTIRPRQPGSSFKPIVYTAAFLKGYTPEMTLWDVNTVFKTDLKNYEPKNYDLEERGPVSARTALQGSLNIPAVKMLYLVGVGHVLDFAEQLGYTTFGDRSRFGLSLVLGGGEVKLLEHTAAYATFANEGKLVKPVSLLKVEDANGAILEEWKEEKQKQVVDREATLKISDVLSDNEARTYVFGGQNYLTLPDRPVAAKTGTTNNYHDAWTMGYTPQLAAGVWVGNNDNSEMRRGADGSVIAAPIWQAFMKRATAEMPVVSFSAPQPNQSTKPILQGKAFEQTIKIDKISGKLATEFTPPDFIEEKIVHEAHSELWYIDKNDPQGPPPSEPSQDLQFENWEAGVAQWVEKESWNTTSTAPLETDDVHTQENRPQVTILSPTENQTLDNRSVVISVSVQAMRRITRTEAIMEGETIGASINGVQSFSARIPNSIQVGYRELTVAAFDDVGNRGEAKIMVNLTAEPAPISAAIVYPENNQQLDSTSFPLTVTVSLTNFDNVDKLDLFLENPQNNTTVLLASEIAPQKTLFTITFNSAFNSGFYYIYPVLVTHDKQNYQGARVGLRVE
ncbi:PBP1A family penicillin-binding protein [Patescibacteria group bacterium]|nr:PBP1A family penicillin-binding protein [Patescibacteria group bacterium]MBU1034657.1 PBP1A family penicillin-binding protein [Patescibacteria group bacterium]